jgi:UDP-N-acetylglucosamine:LPS N-acetylglucosamine transferase
MGSYWTIEEEKIKTLIKGLIKLVKKDENMSIIYRVSGYKKEILELTEMIPSEIRNNFYLTKSFVPQKNILNNENLRLIITHCGLSTIYESLFNGVPMLGIPIAIDQFFNSDMIELYGYGKKLRWGDINEDIIESKINDIINDKLILDKVKNVKNYMRSQNPFKKLKKIIDDGLHFGFDLFDSDFRDDSFFIYVLDSFVFPFFNLFILYLFFKLFFFCFSKIFSIKKNKID